MAIVIDNDIISGLSGMLGNVVFRDYNGKTVVSKRPAPPRTQSEQQKNNRDRFREATAFAKACMLDPQKKEHYQYKARKLKLPNAYTAAVTDFMRKPEVTEVKQKGQHIMIDAGKEGFALASVEVIVADALDASKSLHSATYIRGRRHEWEVHLPDVLSGPGTVGQKIMIVAKDQAGNIAFKQSAVYCPLPTAMRSPWTADC